MNHYEWKQAGALLWGLILVVAAAGAVTEKYRRAVLDVINEYNPDFSFHDLRIDEQGGKKRLSFDLSVPFDCIGTCILQ